MTRLATTAVFLGLLSGAGFALPSPTHAAGNFNARIMLHALAPVQKSGCVRAEYPPSNCSALNAGVNNLQLYPTTYFAYVLVVEGSLTEGVAGFQFGIDYAGGADPLGGFTPINIYSWTLCATLEFTSPSPTWPSPGAGNLITWNATGPQCTNPPGNPAVGAIGVGGYFYLAAYSPAQMLITPRPVDNVAKVANCGSTEDNIRIDPCPRLGRLGFGQAGWNPCGELCEMPVEAATWTDVKRLVSGE